LAFPREIATGLQVPGGTAEKGGQENTSMGKVIGSFGINMLSIRPEEGLQLTDVLRTFIPNLPQHKVRAHMLLLRFRDIQVNHGRTH